jgi:hypothetical protein
MPPSTRTATVLLMFALGLAGCDRPGLPPAPSPVAQPNPPPPASQGPYTLTPSSNLVAPGDQLSVSWTASRGGTKDWIGLFSMGADCEAHGWNAYTDGKTSGTFTLTAPIQLGQYEFRYYPEGSCVDVVRSSPVTVHVGY